MKYTVSHKANRVQLIDLIKGLGLLGILVINIQNYTLFAFLKPTQVYELNLDMPETYAPARFFIHLFVKGQFNTLYCFLFGLVFHLQWEKNIRLGLNASRIFCRGMSALMLIGIIHLYIFSFADELHKYALLGFSLPYFGNKSIATVLKWIVAMVILVIAFQISNTLGFLRFSDFMAESQKFTDVAVERIIKVWKGGSVWDVWQMQWFGTGLVYLKSLKSGFADFVQCEIMLLVGLITGKLNIVGRLPQFRLPLIRMVMWLFPVALLLKSISCLPAIGSPLGLTQFSFYEPLIYSLAEFISVPVLTVVFLVETSIFFQSKQWKLLATIAYAGRMSLSNYLMQTGICMMLFYGYAGGLSGKLTLLESLPIALLIYLFQLVCSTVWFHHFQIGPLGGLLRRWIYNGNQKAFTKSDIYADSM